MVAPGGMRGCSRGGACVVALGGAWLLWGGMCGFLGGWGRAVHGFFGGVCGFSRGACMVAPGGHVWFFGGVCMVFSWGACIGYDEIRSMSGRYASHWNAFLLNMSSLFEFTSF